MFGAKTRRGYSAYCGGESNGFQLCTAIFSKWRVTARRQFLLECYVSYCSVILVSRPGLYFMPAIFIDFSKNFQQTAA
jgi:hypothetical protein